MEVLRIEDNERNTVHKFNMSCSTAFVLVEKVVKVMYVRLMPFVKWPDRTVLQKSMPMQFRIHFGTKCAVIIDCFDMFIEGKLFKYIGELLLLYDKFHVSVK